MQTGNDTTTNTDPQTSPLFIPALRLISDWNCLWGLCRNAACERARQCKRDPRFCLRRYLPLVPDDVRAGVQVLLEGRRDRKTFDEVYDEAPDEIDAVAEWIGRFEPGP